MRRIAQGAREGAGGDDAREAVGGIVVEVKLGIPGEVEAGEIAIERNAVAILLLKAAQIRQCGAVQGQKGKAEGQRVRGACNGHMLRDTLAILQYSGN